MDILILNQLYKYFDKYYTYNAEHDVILSKINSEYKYGNEIISDVSTILAIPKDIVNESYVQWCLSVGMSQDSIDYTLSPKILKFKWNVELANDMIAQNYDFASELNRLLIELVIPELEKEIDVNFLKFYKDELNGDNILNMIECLGYKTSETFYCPDSFTPFKKLIQINKIELDETRRNNTYWKNWIRTRK